MMDLSGPRGDFSMNNTFWGAALDLAQLHGWEPAGTLPPEDAAQWGRGYFSNDGQRVTSEDARVLADALERALPTTPCATRPGRWATPASSESPSGRRRRPLSGSAGAGSSACATSSPSAGPAALRFGDGLGPPPRGRRAGGDGEESRLTRRRAVVTSPRAASGTAVE